MNFAQLIAATALILAGTPVHAQFVRGNEAVRLLPDGTRKVETPPTVGALLAKPCPATTAGCSGGGWKMVETANGLMECTEVYARATTCRPSTYGAQKLARVWVVKIDTRWQHCSYPKITKGCVGLTELPNPAIQ
jgi:hypothetical protein